MDKLKSQKDIRIIFGGEGGQGVQVVAITFAKAMISLGYHVMIAFDYAPAVRGGKSLAMVTLNRSKITNPIFEKADIIIKLSDKSEDYSGTELFCDEPVCGKDERSLPLTKLALECLKNKMFAGMISVGFILHKLGFSETELNYQKFLPSKMGKENQKAIKIGFELARKS